MKGLLKTLYNYYSLYKVFGLMGSGAHESLGSSREQVDLKLFNPEVVEKHSQLLISALSNGAKLSERLDMFHEEGVLEKLDTFSQLLLILNAPGTIKSGKNSFNSKSLISAINKFIKHGYGYLKEIPAVYGLRSIVEMLYDIKVKSDASKFFEIGETPEDVDMEGRLFNKYVLQKIETFEQLLDWLDTNGVVLSKSKNNYIGYMQLSLDIIKVRDEGLGNMRIIPDVGMLRETVERLWNTSNDCKSNPNVKKVKTEKSPVVIEKLEEPKSPLEINLESVLKHIDDENLYRDFETFFSRISCKGIITIDGEEYDYQRILGLVNHIFETRELNYSSIPQEYGLRRIISTIMPREREDDATLRAIKEVRDMLLHYNNLPEDKKFWGMDCFFSHIGRCKGYLVFGNRLYNAQETIQFLRECLAKNELPEEYGLALILTEFDKIEKEGRNTLKKNLENIKNIDIPDFDSLLQYLNVPGKVYREDLWIASYDGAYLIELIMEYRKTEILLNEEYFCIPDIYGLRDVVVNIKKQAAQRLEQEKKKKLESQSNNGIRYRGNQSLNSHRISINFAQELYSIYSSDLQDYNAIIQDLEKKFVEGNISIKEINKYKFLMLNMETFRYGSYQKAMDIVKAKFGSEPFSTIIFKDIIPLHKLLSTGKYVGVIGQIELTYEFGISPVHLKDLTRYLGFDFDYKVLNIGCEQAYTVLKYLEGLKEKGEDLSVYHTSGGIEKFMKEREHPEEVKGIFKMFSSIYLVSLILKELCGLTGVRVDKKVSVKKEKKPRNTTVVIRSAPKAPETAQETQSSTQAELSTTLQQSRPAENVETGVNKLKDKLVGLISRDIRMKIFSLNKLLKYLDEQGEILVDGKIYNFEILKELILKVVNSGLSNLSQIPSKYCLRDVVERVARYEWRKKTGNVVHSPLPTTQNTVSPLSGAQTVQKPAPQPISTPVLEQEVPISDKVLTQQPVPVPKLDTKPAKPPKPPKPPKPDLDLNTDLDTDGGKNFLLQVVQRILEEPDEIQNFDQLRKLLDVSGYIPIGGKKCDFDRLREIVMKIRTQGFKFINSLPSNTILRNLIRRLAVEEKEALGGNLGQDREEGGETTSGKLDEDLFATTDTEIEFVPLDEVDRPSGRGTREGDELYNTIKGWGETDVFGEDREGQQQGKGKTKGKKGGKKADAAADLVFMGTPNRVLTAEEIFMETRLSLIKKLSRQRKLHRRDKLIKDYGFLKRKMEEVTGEGIMEVISGAQSIREVWLIIRNIGYFYLKGSWSKIAGTDFADKIDLVWERIQDFFNNNVNLETDWNDVRGIIHDIIEEDIIDMWDIKTVLFRLFRNEFEEHQYLLEKVAKIYAK